jgi:hypothetical protein
MFPGSIIQPRRRRQEDRDESTTVAHSESTSDNMCHFWRNNHINDFWFFVTMIIYMIYDSYGFL